MFGTIAHWNFLSSDRSNLKQMRWWILVIVSFVGIYSDKVNNWWMKFIKLSWEIILMKMKISASWRHCCKTNVKIHIPLLLNYPQEWQRCQKNWKDLRFLTYVRFYVNIQLNLHKSQDNTKRPAYFDNFCWIWRCFCTSFNVGWILAQK